ncbi:MAG: PQQ-like beta-propeller repeat protein [Deltaproteobacteria bacterium]|nr:PQQ-like beta-propeller repeat protein [Deltaproteobacteria bacterium]
MFLRLVTMLSSLCGLLLLLATASAQAADSRLAGPWPKKHHNEQNTGQATDNGPSTATVKVKPGFPVRLFSRAQTSPTIAPDGTIFLGLGFSPLCAFDPAGGTQALRWCTSDGGDARRSSPTVALDPELIPPGTPPPANVEGLSLASLIVYLGARDNKLWAVKPVPDGAGNAYSVKWRYKIFRDGDIYASPNIDPLTARILLTCRCFDLGVTPIGEVFALEPLPATAQGAANWRAVTDSPMQEASPALHPVTRRIYVGSDAGELYAFSPDGTLVWKSQKFATRSLHSSPVVGTVAPDGSTIIYLSSLEGLHALRDNGDTVEWLWTFPTEGRVESSPALASADGAFANTLYLGDAKGIVYAIKDKENSDGTHSPEEQWREQLTDAKGKKEKLVRVSPAIGANGKIYLAARSTVFALNPGSAGELAAAGLTRVLWKYQVQTKPISWSAPAVGYYWEQGEKKPVLYIGANRRLYAFVE